MHACWLQMLMQVSAHLTAKEKNKHGANKAIIVFVLYELKHHFFLINPFVLRFLKTKMLLNLASAETNIN